MEKKYIVLATNNKNKILEISEVINNMFLPYEIKTLLDFNIYDDIIEDGKTFQDNAKIKAVFVANKLKDLKISAYVLSEDSGLCVNALNGKPGVLSKRYSGGDDNANNKKILKELKNIEDDYHIAEPMNKRHANYVATVCMYDTDSDNITYFTSFMNGKISIKAYGSGGFAYDKIFIPCINNDSYKYEDKTLSKILETNPNRKNNSHRHKAWRNAFGKILMSHFDFKLDEFKSYILYIHKKIYGGEPIKMYFEHNHILFEQKIFENYMVRTVKIPYSEIEANCIEVAKLIKEQEEIKKLALIEELNVIEEQKKSQIKGQNCECDEFYKGLEEKECERNSYIGTDPDTGETRVGYSYSSYWGAWFPSR